MERLPDSIVTPRLHLRRWVGGDGARLGAAVTSSLDHLEPWMQWIAFEPLTVDDREALIDGWTTDWSDGGNVILGVFLEDEVIGGTGLHRRSGPGTLEIGYWIHVDHIGRGYATEIARALTDAAFEVEEIERVEIHHDRANHRSRRVPERLAFTLVGERSRPIVAPAETGVDCHWLMTRTQWVELAEQG